MQTLPGPVTADDVDRVVDIAVTALSAQLTRDWHAPAAVGSWDCWETVEHIGDSLLYYATQLVPVRESIAGAYPFDYFAKRAGGPEGIVFANPDRGAAGLLRVLNACGGLLSALVRAAPPGHTAHHMWGHADAEGFAAMGVVEVLAHLFDVAAPLQIDWPAPDDVCARTLARLFPDAPMQTPPAATLLWATGRGPLPGRPPLDEWRWYGAPRTGGTR